MTEGFAAALAWLLQNEGTAYVDEPDDRGGPTRYGITLRSWGAYCGREVTANDVRALTMADAEAFYQHTLWGPLRGEALAAAGRLPMSIALFDTAALHGLATAVRIAQRVVKVRADGILGPATMATLLAAPRCQSLCAFATRASLRCTEIALRDRTQLKFLHGWVQRSLRLLSLVGEPPQ